MTLGYEDWQYGKWDAENQCAHCDGTGYEPNGADDPRDPGWGEECAQCEGTGEQR